MGGPHIVMLAAVKSALIPIRHRADRHRSFAHFWQFAYEDDPVARQAFSPADEPKGTSARAAIVDVQGKSASLVLHWTQVT